MKSLSANTDVSSFLQKIQGYVSKPAVLFIYLFILCLLLHVHLSLSLEDRFYCNVPQSSLCGRLTTDTSIKVVPAVFIKGVVCYSIPMHRCFREDSPTCVWGGSDNIGSQKKKPSVDATKGLSSCCNCIQLSEVYRNL